MVNAINESSSTIKTQQLIEGHRFDSKVFAQEREFDIRLPKSYANTERDYPVIYLLNANDFYVGELAQDTLSMIERLEKQKGIPESIIVIVQSNDWFGDTITNKTVLQSYLTDELVPFVNNKYRTLNNNSLIGHSYAAAFVSGIPAASNDTFNLALAISPVYPSMEYLGAIQNSYKEIPHSELTLNVSLGDEDIVNSNLLQTTLSKLKKQPFTFTVDKFDHEDHHSVLTIALSKGLRNYFSDFRKPSYQQLVRNNFTRTDIKKLFQRRQSKYQVQATEGDLQSAITAAAQFYLKSEKFDHGFSLWEKSNTKFKAYFMNGIAESFLKRRKTESALIIWKEMASIFPKKAGVYDGLAKGYEALNNISKAIESYEKAVDLGKTNKHPRLEQFQNELNRLQKLSNI